MDTNNSINCDCGELLGTIDTVTMEVELLENMVFTIENSTLRVPCIVCRCPLCKEINNIRGKIK